MNAITLNIDYGALASELADELERRKLLSPQPTGTDLTGVRWNRKQVCGHLGIAERTLADREKLPSFPRRVNDGGQPRWLATEIVDYGLGKPANCSATEAASR